MRDIIAQLFINKFNIMRQIEKEQSIPPDRENRPLIEALHADLDRTNHVLDLCFQSVGL